MFSDFLHVVTIYGKVVDLQNEFWDAEILVVLRFFHYYYIIWYPVCGVLNEKRKSIIKSLLKLLLAVKQDMTPPVFFSENKIIPSSSSL